MNEPRYKIGEFAQLMGVSPDALRYFEDRGILMPQRDQKNGYRYYGIECSAPMTLFRLLRSLGFSYEETLQPSCSIGSSEFVAIMDDKLEDIRREISRLQHKCEGIDEYKNISRRFLADPEYFSIETLDKTFYFYLQFCGDNAMIDKARQPVIRALTAALPLSFFGFVLDRETVFSQGADANDLSGFLIDSKYIPLLNDPEIFSHPDLEIRLHTVCRFAICMAYDDCRWPSRFGQVREALLKQGYEISDAPLVKILPTPIQTTTAYIMEVCLPIQKRSPKNEKGKGE